MKNLGVIIVIVAIVVAVALFMYAWAREQVTTIATRLRKVETEIERDLEELRLTKAMKEYLDRRIQFLFVGIKAVFVLLIGLLWFFLFRSGYDLLGSMFDSVNLVCFAYVAISCLIFNRVTDTNTLLKIIRAWIQVRIYRRNGFDPYIIASMEKTIEAKRLERRDLEKQLDNYKKINNNSLN
ncbi:MAG: hypothetical protein WAZ98_08750 [Cyclobacteriaceae bacterium]